jgi:hypothetical protein
MTLSDGVTSHTVKSNIQVTFHDLSLVLVSKVCARITEETLLEAQMKRF